MTGENLISDYQIFIDVRNKYPELRKLIAEIMRYAVVNYGSFSSRTYLNGSFYEADVKLIFEELKLPLTISKSYPSTLRGSNYTIVELNLN